ALDPIAESAVAVRRVGMLAAAIWEGMKQRPSFDSMQSSSVSIRSALPFRGFLERGSSEAAGVEAAGVVLPERDSDVVSPLGREHQGVMQKAASTLQNRFKVKCARRPHLESVPAEDLLPSEGELVISAAMIDQSLQNLARQLVSFETLAALIYSLRSPQELRSAILRRLEGLCFTKFKKSVKARASGGKSGAGASSRCWRPGSVSRGVGDVVCAAQRIQQLMRRRGPAEASAAATAEPSVVSSVDHSEAGSPEIPRSIGQTPETLRKEAANKKAVSKQLSDMTYLHAVRKSVYEIGTEHKGPLPGGRRQGDRDVP
ncbi:MAG: hypothetical protein SGPRY_010053, partial [Prymnesium sp.]